MNCVLKKNRLTALLLASFITLAAGTATTQAPPTLVRTDEVRSMEFHDQITLVGRTEAKVKSRIVAEVSGQVAAVNAAEGNPINAGQPLVSIDASRIALDLQAKEAEAMQAKAQADLAESNLKRIRELHEQELIPETTLDSAAAWVTITRQQFLQLDAERARLARDHERAVIRAPYDGYTLRKMVDIGEWVDPGTPVYAMVDLSEVLVAVDLPERHYGQLEIGSDVVVTVSGSKDTPVQGRVTGIARSANEDTHTFPVIVTVPNDDGRLAGGSLVRATLFMSGKFTSLAVSKDAIVRQGTQTFVYTVNDGKAVMVPVIVGSTQGNMIAVSGDGLSEGMPVVVRGNERIFPGSPVQIQGAEQTQDERAESSSSATSEHN
jgi:RND family efflux transporter MFP subunit